MANDTTKLFRCKIGEDVHGPVTTLALRKLPGFTLRALIAPEGSEDWQPVYKTINLSDLEAPAAPAAAGKPLDAGLLQAWAALSSNPVSAPGTMPLQEKSAPKAPSSLNALQPKRHARSHSPAWVVLLGTAVASLLLGGSLWLHSKTSPAPMELQPVEEIINTPAPVLVPPPAARTLSASRQPPKTALSNRPVNNSKSTAKKRLTSSKNSRTRK